MSATRVPFDLNTPDGCRDYAAALPDEYPDGPATLSAIGQADWHAEAALLEREARDLKAPFPWFGGKSRCAHLVWPRLGRVANYVEPFAGSLAVLLARPHPPRLETVNDLDCYLDNFWRAVAWAPDEVAAFADWPVNECALHARHRWLVEQTRFQEQMRADPYFYCSHIAGWWVWGISMWIGSGWCSRPDGEGRAHAGRAPRGGVHEKRPNIAKNGGGGVTSDWRVRPDLSWPRGVGRKRPGLNSRGMPGVHNLPEKKIRTDRAGASGTVQSLNPRQQIPTLQGRKGSETHRDFLCDWMGRLSERLRRVRVCCGDWRRVVTPSVTWKIGGSMLTGVLLDPPYDLRAVRGREHGSDGAAPSDALYSHHDNDTSREVAKWAIENGGNPLMRIALCGYEGEHDMPAEWECVAWKANGGYGNASDKQGRRNADRERIWFSPHCLKPENEPQQVPLFGEVEA